MPFSLRLFQNKNQITISKKRPKTSEEIMQAKLPGMTLTTQKNSLANAPTISQSPYKPPAVHISNESNVFGAGFMFHDVVRQKKKPKNQNIKLKL